MFDQELADIHGSRRGFVYVLSNDSMPGIVKIGRTTRPVEQRAAELWKTGVPTPFEVWGSVSSFDCVQLEAYVHGDLARQRVSKGREFFRIDPMLAVEKVREWALLQTCSIVDELDENFVVAPYSKSVDRFEIDRLSDELGQHPRLVCDAIQLLAADELRPAIFRARAKLEAECPEHLAVLDGNYAEGATK